MSGKLIMSYNQEIRCYSLDLWNKDCDLFVVNERHKVHDVIAFQIQEMSEDVTRQGC